MNKLLKLLGFKCCTPTSIFKEKTLRKDMFVFRCRNCSQAFVSEGGRGLFRSYSEAELEEHEFCISTAQLDEISGFLREAVHKAVGVSEGDVFRNASSYLEVTLGLGIIYNEVYAFVEGLIEYGDRSEFVYLYTKTVYQGNHGSSFWVYAPTNECFIERPELLGRIKQARWYRVKNTIG